MKKREKRKAQLYIELLKKIQRMIEIKIIDGQVDNLYDDFSTCQQRAIELGNFIEDCDFDGSSIVISLEEYCEKIYKIYQEIVEGQIDDIKLIEMNLDEALQVVSESIASTPTKMQAVFLPYKASMWDSLESIWMAADADESCDATVMPIPYFDKNQDGTFKEMHYEGDLFPEYVPITNYEEYDFENELPDMVFVHNPYDEYNYVTSVHPFFYSANIKKYTDKLVYVPYFASSIRPGEDKALMASYFNFDYIVVQSPEFINYFDKAIPREKFLPFGSPKFDCVINKVKNGVKISDEIKKKIDGRKTFFYNTSLNGMLADTDAFMKKMEYVFNTVKDNPQVCVVWRPHPLFESTLESLRPTYLNTYLTLKKRFIDEDLGIFDDNPNVDGTVAMCDAYIGDAASSITSLFGVCGKPIFILNNAINKKPSKEDILLETVHRVEARLESDSYLTRDNHLYLKDGTEFKYYTNVFTEPETSKCAEQVEYKEKIYIPVLDGRMIVIDKKGERREYTISNNCKEVWSFQNSIKYEHFLILLPCDGDELIIYDMESEKYISVSGMQEFIGNRKDIDMSIVPSYIDEGVVHLLNARGNCSFSINLNTHEYWLEDVPFNEPIYKIYKDDYADLLWAIPYEGYVTYSLNVVTNEVTKYELYIEGMEAFYKCKKDQPVNNRIFGSIAFTEKAIYLAPYFGNKFARINRENGQVEEWKPNVKYNFYIENPYIIPEMCSNFRKSDNEQYMLYFYPERKLYSVDFEENILEEIEYSFDVDDIQKHSSGYVKSSEYVKYGMFETSVNSLDDFLRKSDESSNHKKEKQLACYLDVNASPNGDCGEKVYNKLTGRPLVDK